MTNPDLNDILKSHTFDLWDHSILLGYVGSISHGTVLAGKNSIDDKDVMGIIIPPLEYTWGLKVFKSKGTGEFKRGHWDVVIYEFKKMMSLLLKCNPNVISFLWLNGYLKLRNLII